MSKYIALFLFALIATSFAAQQGSGRRVQSNPPQKEKNDLKWWNDSKAAILTSRSFEGIVGKDKYVVVQFCATFSKECEEMQPQYNALADLYSGANPKHPNVFIGKIDGWTFNSLSQTYAVKRFPTIRFFNKNDATNSDEYTGEITAEAVSKWIEDLIKAKEAPKTEEKKPEEAKKEQTHEQVITINTNVKQPEATNTQANQQQNNQQQNNQQQNNQQQNNQQQQQQNQQVQQTQQTQPPKAEEEGKKEFKLVLNTTLLQGQFDEVQAQLNKLSEALQKSISENFKKVETLSHNFELHKKDFHTLSESLRHQQDKLHHIGENLHHAKEDIKGAVTGHTEHHLNQIKDHVHNIKSKVHERKEEGGSGPGLLHNLIYMIIGGAVGAGIVFALGGGKKKNRSMLD